jgi:gas vesicle protein
MNERIYYSREAEEQARRERTLLVLAAIAIGVGVGTIFALMFAPQAGRKTREQLGDQLEQAASQGLETASRIREDVEQRVEAIRK